MTHSSWLWPDRVIGKRESRRLRDEHNALVNRVAQLVKENTTLLQVSAENDLQIAKLKSEQAMRVANANGYSQALDAIAAYVRARNDGGISMADLSTIADNKLRTAHEAALRTYGKLKL